MDKSQDSKEFGQYAESITADSYLKQGFTVLERNWRLGKTEIDLIVQKDDTLVIVEVKGRSGRDEEALSTVTRDKRRRMIRAADNYIKRLTGNYNYRFDIATVTGQIGNCKLEIYEDAFVAADYF